MSTNTINHSTVIEVTGESDFNQYASNFPPSALLVIYFHAPWAAPCKQMSTVLDALASTYSAESPQTIGFLSINAEEVPEISEAYDVTSVPYIVLQKGGQTVETVSGSSAAKLREAVERHAGKGNNADKVELPPVQQVTKATREPAGLENGALADTSNEGTNKEELFKRLETLVKAAPVMLFMKGTPSAPQCGFSRQTVGLLREKGIRYGFFNILADDEVRQGLKEFSDWPTFPQLYVGGELVGGLDIVKEEFSNDPEFLKEYSVNNRPAAPEPQAQPA